MHIPEHFAETCPEHLHRIIRDNPFGILVTHSESGLEADHIPFEFDASAGAAGVLFAHVARANPLWQRCPSGTPVMAVFRGAHAYVSPNWYPSKHQTHRQVPTWNYEVVHAHGTMRVMDEEKFVRRVLALLTRHHESGEENPWRMADAPKDYLAERVAETVGIEIELVRLEGKRKLSQNKQDTDRWGVISNLRQRGHEALAASMEEALGPR